MQISNISSCKEKRFLQSPRYVVKLWCIKTVPTDISILCGGTPPGRSLWPNEGRERRAQATFLQHCHLPSAFGFTTKRFQKLGTFPDSRCWRVGIDSLCYLSIWVKTWPKPTIAGQFRATEKSYCWTQQTTIGNSHGFHYSLSFLKNKLFCFKFCGVDAKNVAVCVPVLVNLV